MEPWQEEFILKELSSHPCCDIRVTPDVLDAVTVNEILDQRLISVSQVDALLHLFSITSLLVTPNNEESQFCGLDPSIEAWLLYARESHVAKELVDVGLRDVDAVIKSPKKGSSAVSNREYLIGVTCLNRLRRVTPIFAYTLGALTSNHNDGDLFIVYERVPGNSLADHLRKGMSFQNWLHLFVQILIGLELAQKEVGFSHSDLHADNIMVRPTFTKEYNIPLDLSRYTISETEMTPVVVDFGMSTAAINGQVVGTYDYGVHGVFNFMVPGHDMYRIMVSSCVHATNLDTQRQIMDLFRFFRKTDPYSVVAEGRMGIARANDEYCRDVAFSKMAYRTPLEMLDWVRGTHRKYLSSFIRVQPREEYLSFWGLGGKVPSREARDITEATIATNSSYAVPRYFIHLLRTYGDTGSEIDPMHDRLEAHRSDLLKVDMTTLSRATSILVPSQDALTRARKSIEGTCLRSPPKLKKARAFALQKLLHYEHVLQPYIQLYLIILELDLCQDYAKWLTKLRTSKVFVFHTKNVTLNSHARRWSETLLASIIDLE